MADEVKEALAKVGTLSMMEENIPPNGSLVQRRLTKVERARLEVLAAFGNCGFDTMIFKQGDFRAKLKATSKNSTTCNDTGMPKRLTRMQRARLETNEAFKNVPLGVKRKASHSESNSVTSTGNVKRRPSRPREIQQSAQNAASKNDSIQKLQEEKNNQKNTARRESVKRTLRIAQVQAEKQEAMKNFGGRPLDRVTKERRKSANKGRLSRRVSSSRRGSSGKRRSSARMNPIKRRMTKVQAAQLEALQSFGGESLGNLLKPRENSELGSRDETPKSDCGTMEVDALSHDKKEKQFKCCVSEKSWEPGDVATAENVSRKEGDSREVVDPVEEKRKQVECCVTEKPGECIALTASKNVSRKEGDSREGVDSLKENVTHCKGVSVGQQEGVTVLIHRDVIPGNDLSSHQEQPGDEFTGRCSSSDGNSTQVKDAYVGLSPHQPRDCHMKSTLMSPIPEHAQSENPTTLEPSSEHRHLTRLEKARLEALKSFHGQAFDQVIRTSSRKMAKYLTPVKHQGTNTDIVTKTTPSQTEDSYNYRAPRPKRSCYSNLGDKSISYRGALLETSKIVVMTARSLTTPSPDCSPSSNNQ